MKKNELLLELIGEADPRWVPDLKPEKNAAKRKRLALTGGAVAAALLVGFIAVRSVWNPRAPVGTETPSDHASAMTSGGPEDSWEGEQLDEEYGPSAEQDQAGGLPKITAGLEVGGMGFEGLMAFSIDQLENGNPWRELPADTNALPVYRNLVWTTLDAHGEAAVYPTAEELRGAAEETAGALPERRDLIRSAGGGNSAAYAKRISTISAACFADGAVNVSDMPFNSSCHVRVSAPIDNPLERASARSRSFCAIDGSSANSGEILTRVIQCVRSSRSCKTMTGSAPTAVASEAK